MKCVQSTKAPEPIERVTDDKAAFMVYTGYFKYVPKSAWKAQRQEKSNG